MISLVTHTIIRPVLAHEVTIGPAADSNLILEMGDLVFTGVDKCANLTPDGIAAIHGQPLEGTIRDIVIRRTLRLFKHLRNRFISFFVGPFSRMLQRLRIRWLRQHCLIGTNIC